MRIAVDVSRLDKDNLDKHRVRGSGSYIDGLTHYLPKYDKENEYLFVFKGEELRDIDLVHYPYFEPFFLSLPQKSRIPSVVTVHDLIPLVFPKQFPAGIKGKIKWSIQKASLKRKNRIITDSNASKTDIETKTGIPSSKISVVYLAPSEAFKKESDRKDIRKKYNLPENFLLYVGDATWNKNLIRLAEAVKRTDFKLVMVGKALVGNEAETNNRWNKELIGFKKITEGDSRFVQLGLVSNEDLNALYNIASSLIMPSLYEGFGLPIVEAMACGCPVISSKEGSLGEIAGNAAYSIDPYSVDSIEKGIREVLGDGALREKLSKDGFDRSKDFSWKKTVSNTVSAYKLALKNE